jgi:hypothetical protein
MSNHFARAADLDLVPYGERECPVGSIDKVYNSVAQLHGFEVVRHSSRPTKRAGLQEKSYLEVGGSVEHTRVVSAFRPSLVGV